MDKILPVSPRVHICMMNDTICNIDPRPITSLTLEFVVMCCLIVTSLIALFGNAAVLIVIRLRRNLHRPSYFLLANLAIGDFATNIIIVPAIVTTMIMRHWIFGHTLCQLSAFVINVSIIQTLGTLTSVSIDRYIAICAPLRYPTLVTSHRSLIMITYTWVHACVVSVPPCLGFSSYGFQPTYYSCNVASDDSNSTGFAIFFTCSTLLPMGCTMAFW